MELFEACGIPDTLDGRLDSLALHAALMIDRLRREPDGEELSQAFFDAMFRHLDLTLREIGVQDLGVGRRIKIMAEGLHGRALAYREALAGGATPLDEVLRRNAYGGRPPAAAAVARLEAHVRQYALRLDQASRHDLLKLYGTGPRCLKRPTSP
jgi:cytochrome b pre-mRNA-processing protein 3